MSLFCVLTAISAGGLADSARPKASPALAAVPLTVETRPNAATPTPTVEPSPQPSVSALFAQELTTKKAPIPPGLSTRVPILLYHYIRVNPVAADRVGFNLSTTPKMFAAQMQYLADHGFNVISLRAAVVAIQQHHALPPRPVVLTFDDGYADFVTAAMPAMRAHGFTATEFVISGRMGVSGFMSAAQVQTADQLGFTIGAHTVDHYALAALTPARASWEMRQSKLALEAVLGHPVIDFAYPYGSFNAYDMSQARALGFETAVSTLVGSVHTPAQLMYLSRLRVGGAMSLATFAQLVGGPSPASAPSAQSSVRPSATPAPTPFPSPTSYPSPSATPSASPSPRPTP
ncbi:MAG: polysaccharide deacetylase family protein [Candidatus Dormibacteraeota bacterium]|nr:polysaccharide deacetylase family protein [Candidatus Dormibacteraeota bacterium]